MEPESAPVPSCEVGHKGMYSASERTSYEVEPNGTQRK